MLFLNNTHKFEGQSEHIYKSKGKKIKIVKTHLNCAMLKTNLILYNLQNLLIRTEFNTNK